MPKPVAIWLVPAEPDRSELTRQIARLSAEHAAPAFECHVTIFSTETHATDPARVWSEILAGVAARHRPLTLTATGIYHSADFFKALFFELRTDASLAALQADIGHSVSASADLRFSPHMSLLYRELAPEIRAELATSIPPPAPIRADTLVAVMPGPTGDWHDVADWQELARHRLSPG